MTDVSEEFERATQYRLTDEDLERARMLLGLDAPSRFREHVTRAEHDSIRNFATGLGDDNPLFTDEDYGTGTRWGSQIAPNIMAAVINHPLLGDPLPEEVRKGTRGMFRGVHVFVSGGTWDWYRPVLPGDRLFTFSGEESIEVKDSEFAGRSAIRVTRNVKFNQRAEVVGLYRVVRVLTERKAARELGKYSEITPATYTDDDIARIDEAYHAEQRRGAEPRWWEDVQVGDVLPPMAKGPLTTTDIVAFHAGGYGFVPYGLPTSRLAAYNRRRIAAFYVKNEYGVPDVAQRLHWDSAWAQAIGNPMAYDYGVMRECWFHHYLTDWAGDDAFIEHQYATMRKFNYHGDIQYLSGTVVAKRQVEGRHLVDLELHMTNQRDTETSAAEATISLPSRLAGPALLPVAPQELTRSTAQMWARHHELQAQARANPSPPEPRR